MTNASNGVTKVHACAGLRQFVSVIPNRRIGVSTLYGVTSRLHATANVTRWKDFDRTHE